MLTKELILLTWEQDWDETKYFTFTHEGDSVGYDIELDQFYLGDYKYEISHGQASKLLA
jgi:hypothetical protein